MSLSNPAQAGTACTVHVWALEAFEGQFSGGLAQSSNGMLTRNVSSSVRSELMQAPRRLAEIDESSVRSALHLDADYPVMIHKSEPRMFVDRNAKTPLSGSTGQCQYDWIIRPTGLVLPVGYRNYAAYEQDYALFSMRSYFRAFDASGKLTASVNGEHKNLLPVLARSNDPNLGQWDRYTYDTAAGTKNFLINAGAKILAKVHFSTLGN
jgi:hypothetical protein